MAIYEHEDGPLPLALRRLGDAVHNLVDEIPVWSGGVCRWSTPVYTRLRGALVGRSARIRMASGSRVPCRADVLVWLIDVDTTVAAWTPDEKGGTTDRLHALTARGWRPQDHGLLGGHCDAIERWILDAAELLGDRAPAVALRMPCPSCGETWSYRRTGAEEVRGWALRVTESGCECRACKAFWEPTQYEFLARLLNCEPLPGACL